MPGQIMPFLASYWNMWPGREHLLAKDCWIRRWTLGKNSHFRVAEESFELEHLTKSRLV